MLEFIVLGQIPGTTVQITFIQVSIAGITFFGIVYGLRKLTHLLKSPSISSHNIEERAL
jgi:hypothetical protein